ncbi:PhzF family phenazine biosynthesis protein [Bordetella genomosp. 9]|uniref:Phenazine biosynthesis protein PhzC/PhzF n=1 Tax=Bordetella genomosp. 9 TaxID=1416803 RepID=A0A1W6YXY9_9BORD|nr:PhzF family phenazine biosynthesis protein [Bordetella genomosp. 9]ARP85926.1 phenazine biosynthesis protein PhzC/PhzF [Bordetella genomosp. 9]
MRTYRFRILNVFAESAFGGNPLCVFEDGRGLSDAEMQALALQFNLSETTFILPSEAATARVRIFTPGYEMPFAGHPTLGTSQVVRALTNAGDRITLEMQAGIVPVQAEGNVWTFAAPGGASPKVTAPSLPAERIAAQMGVMPRDLAGAPLWVDTGAHQLLIPLGSADAVRRAAPDPALLAEWEISKAGRKTAYLFAFDGHGPDGAERVVARYFFVKPGGGVVEDPGTGSACANLGGWAVATGRALPLRARIEQGEQTGRPCVLGLEVTADKEVRVQGQVWEFGDGVISLP